MSGVLCEFGVDAIRDSSPETGAKSKVMTSQARSIAALGRAGHISQSQLLPPTSNHLHLAYPPLPYDSLHLKIVCFERLHHLFLNFES